MRKTKTTKLNIYVLFIQKKILSFKILQKKKPNQFQVETDSMVCIVVVPIEMSISANERNYSGVIRSLISDTACDILTFQMTHIRLCS